MRKIIILAFALLAFAAPSFALTVQPVHHDTTIVEKHTLFATTYTIDGRAAKLPELRTTLAQKPQAAALFQKATKGERTATVFNGAAIGFLVLGLLFGGLLWYALAVLLLIPALIIGIRSAKNKAKAFLFFNSK
jgi:hypothetical protein